MSDNERELNQIQIELNQLHERSQNNKANISAHEAVCEERYAQIIATLSNLTDELRIVHKKLNEVNDLATQGKTSLRTLLWVGGLVSGIIATMSLLFGFFPK